MSAERRVPAPWILFVFLGLLGACGRHEAAVPRSGSGNPVTLLREADLFHDEYRQNLDGAMARAREEVANAPTGLIRGVALIFEARVHRLRGEYKSALLRLQEAEPEIGHDPMAHVRLLAERRLTDIDQHSTPWGLFENTAEDVHCWRPRFQDEAQEYGAAHKRAMDEFAQTPPGLPQDVQLEFFNEGNGLSQWANIADWFATWKYVHGSQSIYRSKEVAALSGQLMQFDATDIDDNLRLWGPPSGVSAERAGGLRVRLVAPILLHDGSLEQALDQLGCKALEDASPRDDLLRGQIALTCAETELFPGGTADDLGHYIPRYPESDDLFAYGADLWDGMERVRARRARVSARPTGWLDIADRAFAKAGAHRGQARVAFVRAADSLSTALTSQAPRQAAAGLFDEAVRLSWASGDGRLWRLAQTLSAATLALRGERAAAHSALQPVLAAVRAEIDVGHALGAARLLGSLAGQQAFVRYDPTSAEILDELALQTYDSAGIRLEAARLDQRRARVFGVTGNKAKAAAVLEESLALLDAACNEPGSMRTTILRANIYSELDLTFQDLGDLPGDERAFEGLRTAALTLSGGRTDRAALAARGAELDRESAAAMAQVGDLGARLRRENDPTAHETLKRQVIEANARFKDLAGRAQTAQRAADYLNILRGMEAHLQRWKDRQAIVSNPDLPRPQQYAATEQLVKDRRTRDAHHTLAIIAMLRGDFVEARRSATAGGTDLSDDQPVLSSLVPDSVREKLTLRHRVVQLQSDAAVFVRVRAYDQARAIQQQLAQLRGSPKWYMQLQEPWTEIMNHVQVEGGLGEHDAALAHAQEMLRLAEARREGLFDERFRQTFFNTFGGSAIYGVAVTAAARANKWEAVIDTMERGKARSLQEAIAGASELRRFRELASGISLLEQTHREQCSTGGAPECVPMAAELERRRAEYDGLLTSAEGAAVRPDAASFQGIGARIRARLSKGTVMLHYFFDDTRLVIAGLAPDREPVLAVTDITPAVVEGRIRRLGVSLLRRLDDSPAARDATELSDLLFGAPAIRKLLLSPGAKSLVLVPHRVLHEVPFANLPFEGKALVERFAISVLPVGALALTPRKPRSSGAPLDASVLFYPGDDPAHALSGAASEAASIASLYGAKPTAAPDRAAVLSALARTGAVHLVAHGQASPTLGQASIDLPRVSDTDDGDLRVTDILFHDHALTADVVVLSACQLALGRRTPGDEGIGIPRALVQKGAGAVVAPLWQIDDVDKVVQLLTSLHTKLRGGAQAAEALASVQREAIRRHDDPAYWAGFVVLGGMP